MNSLALLIAMIAPAAPPEVKRPVPLRLERGQEFVFHGVYNQESERPGSQSTRLLDTYVLILDASRQGAHAAIMTVARVDNKAGTESVPVVRLEYARIDPLGRLTLDSTNSLPHLPIDGPPALDPLPFVELPAVMPEGGQPWESVDADQSPVRHRLLATEFHRFDRCWKLRSDQSSGDWNIAGRTVWKRGETAWMSLQFGFVVRRERTTEWRLESGETWKSTLVAELELMPPASIQQDQFHDRKLEIKAGIEFARELTELMEPRGEPDYRGYDNLLRSIDRYASHDTPYAIFMKSLRRRAELARGGELPPDPLIIRTQKEPAKPADEGEFAPTFVAKGVGGRGTLRSSELTGRPTVMVFVKPSSRFAGDVIRYSQAATKSYAGRINVFVLSVEGPSPELAKWRAMGQLEVPVYEGQSILPLFAGRSTPRFVLLNKEARIHVIHSGWNAEFHDLIHKELLRLVN